MNIQNIQIAQGLLRVTEGKMNSGKGDISAESDSSLNAINLPEAQENKISLHNSNLSKEQGDVYEIFYPPFFPLGNTQGIYSVMMQSKPDSLSTDSRESQKTGSATAMEDTAVRQQEHIDLDKADRIIKNKAPETTEKVHPGSVLDFKV